MAANKAAAEFKAGGVASGYVEDFAEARTKLAAIISTLLTFPLLAV